MGGYDCVIWTADALARLTEAGLVDSGGKSSGMNAFPKLLSGYKRAALLQLRSKLTQYLLQNNSWHTPVPLLDQRMQSQWLAPISAVLRSSTRRPPTSPCHYRPNAQSSRTHAFKSPPSPPSCLSCPLPGMPLSQLKISFVTLLFIDRSQHASYWLSFLTFC